MPVLDQELEAHPENPRLSDDDAIGACETTGRVAQLLELDPRYCDLICRRHQEMTGTMAIDDKTGKPHDFAGD